MSFKGLSNEQLIAAYLNAHKQRLEPSFLEMLFNEIMRRDIYDLLFETSLRT
ncbi:sporulation histidine kinase inhibitor Sda [Neobacillus sp. NPDC093182]|uniref:sporulation histidine kinase inhibitor Sda n=1 Tax=Neobacillus sp. NPDC093182 TaxID=3364297 RepID=UPI00382FB2C8